MSESNNEYYFKPSGSEIKDFNKAVNKIGSINNYMEKNYKTMDNLLKQPETIYILSYLSRSDSFSDLTNTGDSSNELWNVDDLIKYLNNEKELDEETENNISKWKNFLNTVPEDFKKLAGDLNKVYRGQKNANEVNCFGDDDVKKLLDQITPKKKSKTLETSEVSSNSHDDSMHEYDFKISDDLIKDFNKMVNNIGSHNGYMENYKDMNFLASDYRVKLVVSYLSQCDHFDKITNVDKDDKGIYKLFKDINKNKELDEETSKNIDKWKKFLSTVNEAHPNFLKGCKELKKITHESTDIRAKKTHVNPIKTFFKWLFSGTKDSFTNYFNQENNKTKEKYIKEKKENSIRPLSKVLFNAKQRAKETENEQKNIGNSMQV